MRLMTIFLFALLLLPSCAYDLGYKNRNLPGNYKSVRVPVFTNETMITGLETYFTNELKGQFYRSKIADINSQAPIKIVGKIRRVYIDQTQARGNQEDFKNLPANTVLTTTYNMTVDVKILVVRLADKKVIWQSDFSDYLPYSGAQLKLEGVNASNTLYNQSEIQDNVKSLAQIMMSEAHSRLTENF